MKIHSKLPDVGMNIFSVMTTLANEHDAINLSQGFPDFSSSPELIALVHHYMKKGFNQYAPMPGLLPLRQQITKKAKELYGIRLSYESEITVTCGATQALSSAITAFVHPGDEVIIIEPAFDTYRPLIDLCGGITIAYELSAPDYAIDWDGFGKLISPKTKMIVINSPHNPSGMLLEETDMKALMKLVDGTDIIILSDEVYEHLIFDGKQHQSVLSYPELFRRSLVTFSFGKTFHNTGWKIGYCIAPAGLMKELRKVHQFVVFSVNRPIQHALADFLSEPSHYLDLPAFFQQKRDFFLKAMEGSRLKPLHCGGTYFQLFDYSTISNESDIEFAKRLTAEYGVASIPVSAFYDSGHDDKVIRFCFAKEEDTLKRAGELLKKL